MQGNVPASDIKTKLQAEEKVALAYAKKKKSCVCQSVLCNTYSFKAIQVKRGGLPGCSTSKVLWDFRCSYDMDSSILLFLTKWRTPADVQRGRSCQNTNELLCSQMNCTSAALNPSMDKGTSLTKLQYLTAPWNMAQKEKQTFHPLFILSFNLCPSYDILFL